MRRAKAPTIALVLLADDPSENTFVNIMGQLDLPVAAAYQAGLWRFDER